MIKRSQSAGRAQIDRFCTDRRRLMPCTNWRHIGGYLAAAATQRVFTLRD
jgi:hypothetical protein